MTSGGLGADEDSFPPYKLGGRRRGGVNLGADFLENLSTVSNCVRSHCFEETKWSRFWLAFLGMSHKHGKLVNI